MFLQGAVWPEHAIRDSVAVIVRQAGYQRSLRETLMSRLLRWLYEYFIDIVSAFGQSPIAIVVSRVLLVALLLLLVARMVLGAVARNDVAAQEADVVRRLQGVDPWAESQRLAGAGRYTEAAHALFAALLVTCAARGELRLHSSKTAGDYARELRRGTSPTYAPFQAFRRRYDRIIYGSGTCNADGWVALMSDARVLLAPERAA